MNNNIEYHRNYNRIYYNKKYNTDPEYREKWNKYVLSRYIPRNLKCIVCNKKKQIKYMQEIGYEYDPNNFYCTECLPINCPNEQVKPRAGKSIKTNNVLFIS